MTDRDLLAQQSALLGQAFLCSDPRRLSPPEDAAEGPFAAFRDEIRLAQGVPEAAELEYTRLFISPAGAPCSPWQSAYAPEPRLMGPAHHSALEWYRRYGAEPAVENEPADHAGLLLFFAQLAANEADDQELRAFAASHLIWMTELVSRMKTEARHPLYLSLARATEHLLASLASKA